MVKDLRIEDRSTVRAGSSRGRVAPGAVGLLVLVVAALVAFSQPQAWAQDANPGVVTVGDPVVGTPLTATLADDDTVQTTPAPTWQWAKAKRPDGTFTNLSGNGAGTATYTPQQADHAYFLRATVTYDDSLGTGRTAVAVTTLPVGVTARTLVSSAGPPFFNGRYSSPTAFFDRFLP